MQLEQVDANATAAPTGMGTPQLQARLLHGQLSLGQLATTQVGAWGQIVTLGQVAPLGQQSANGSDRQRQLLSDVRRA